MMLSQTMSEVDLLLSDQLIERAAGLDLRLWTCVTCVVHRCSRGTALRARRGAAAYRAPTLTGD